METAKHETEQRPEGPPPVPEAPREGERTPERQAADNLAESVKAAQTVSRDLERIDRGLAAAGVEYAADEKGDRENIADGLEATIAEERQRTGEAIEIEIEALPPPLPKDEGRSDHGLEQREHKEKARRARQTIELVLANQDLQAEAAIGVLAEHETEPSQELINEANVVAAAYGLTVEGMPEADRQELLALYQGFKRSTRESPQANLAEAVEKKLHQRLISTALERVDSLKEQLLHSRDLEQMKDSLRQTMESLAGVAKGMRNQREGEGSERFQEVFRRFDQLKRLKRAGKVDQVNHVFGEVFREFQDFIEDDILSYRIQKLEEAGKPFSVEHLVQDTYGRSKEEVEQVKAENRQRVAETIKRMAEEEYGITLDMVQELHRVNNDSIVPKGTEQVRNEQGITFGKARRMGLIGEDVRKEMDLLIDRANLLIDRKTLGKVSDTRYTIEAAALHNDMLDIHPFDDRNGSTSLLFLELMMAQQGVEPPAKREKDYYRKLRKIVGNNLAAVAVVGYEQLKMTYRPGHYQGEHTDTTERYYKILQRRERQRLEQEKAALAAEKADSARAGK